MISQEFGGCKPKKTIQYVCTFCGINERRTIEEQGEHTWDSGKITTEATCNSSGVKTYTCFYCKTTKTENYIDKEAHPYEWLVTKQPSGTRAASEADFGIRVQKCSICQEEGQTQSMINIDGTKIICGVFDNDAADDLFERVNKERNNAITNIEDEFGNAIGVTKVPSLERDTELDFIAKLRAAQCAIRCDHWDKDGNPVYLTDNENLASGQGTAREVHHAWCYSTEHRNTMIELDYKIGGCANFWYDADGSGENLYPLWVLTLNQLDFPEGHSHSYAKTVIAPTCQEEGYTILECECGDRCTVNYTDKLSHNYQTTVTIEPTCTQPGESRSICTYCGKETDNEPIVIPPIHKWGEWTITKDAGTAVHTTIDEFGERVTNCTVCGETKTESIVNIDASAYDESDPTFAIKEALTFVSDDVIQTYGVFCEDMAYETLERTNELRKSLGLNELGWYEPFSTIGHQRGAEISIKFSHERPNGKKASYTNSVGMEIKLGENIALNYKSVEAVFSAWCNSPGHYANIIKDTYTKYYAACFRQEFTSEYITQYGYVWVQLFK